MLSSMEGSGVSMLMTTITHPTQKIVTPRRRPAATAPSAVVSRPVFGDQPIRILHIPDPRHARLISSEDRSKAADTDCIFLYRILYIRLGMKKGKDADVPSVFTL